MEIVIIIVLVVVSAALLGWRLLGKAGIGNLHGKPDCGCGSCAAKRKGHAK